MDWIYLASAIFGGSFLIPMVLGGLATDTEFGADADFDVDTDFEIDADFDTDFEIDADLSDAASGHHLPDSIGQGFSAADAIVGSLLSFRSVVFFAAFFGLTGLLLGALGYGFLLTLVTAAVLGAVAAVANSAVFGLLKASESSSQVTDRSLLGRRGVVTVPIANGQRGRVRIDLGGQPQYVSAAALSDGDTFDAGHPVTVVQLEDSVALVVSLKKELDDLDQQLEAGPAGQLSQGGAEGNADSSATQQSQSENQNPHETQNEEG